MYGFDLLLVAEEGNSLPEIALRKESSNLQV